MLLWLHQLSNARFVEYFTDDQVLNFRRLINRQLDFKNGDLILHQSPGIGFTFDEAEVKKYSNGQSWVKIQ
jgi:L-alanine-DL-glutamate epimerase-like enolase superfamily enzyme